MQNLNNLSHSRRSSSLYYSMPGPGPRPVPHHLKNQDMGMVAPPHRDPNAGTHNMSYGHAGGENRKRRKNNRGRKPTPSTETNPRGKRDRFTPGRNSVTIEAGFKIPFGRKPKMPENKAVNLQKESGHKRSMFFDYSNGGQVNFERSASPVFADPYTLPKDGNSRLWFKAFEFVLFDFPDKAANPAQFEIVSLFNKMILDIKVAANSAMFANITSANLKSYFKAVSQCLIEYYEIDSLMANDTNTYDSLNQGVKTLWDEASKNPQLLETQFRLRRAIRGCYLPPKVLSFLVWASQFYLFDRDGDTRKGVFKFSWGLGMKSYQINTDNYPYEIAASNSNYEAHVNDLINKLYSAQSDTKVQAALAKTYPDWEIKDLPLSCNQPTYDERALDIWTNSTSVTKSGVSSFFFPDKLTTGIAANHPREIDKIVVPCHQGSASTSSWDTSTKWNFFYRPSLMDAVWQTPLNEWALNYDVVNSESHVPASQTYYSNVKRATILSDKFKIYTPNIHNSSEVLMKYPVYTTDTDGEVIRLQIIPSDTIETRPVTEQDTSLIVAEAIQHLLV